MCRMIQSRLGFLLWETAEPKNRKSPRNVGFGAIVLDYASLSTSMI